MIEWKAEMKRKLEERTGASEDKEGKTRNDKGGQEEEKEKWNKRDVEWMIEENEREKRRLNLIITGLKMNKTYEKQDIKKWILDNIRTEVKINKVWKFKTYENSLKGYNEAVKKKRGRCSETRRDEGSKKYLLKKT